MQNTTTFQVYNASAGSGKTFTLVKSYLKIVLATSDTFKFKQILAITFTNKAANEMKERILLNLRAFADGDFSNMTEMLCQEIPLSKTVLQKRAGIVLKEIVNNYSAFAITTIDSFTYKIIRNFAFDLGLSLNFDVELNTKNVLDEAVELLMSKIGKEDKITDTLLPFAMFKWQKDETWDISFALKTIAKLLVDESAITELDKLKSKQLPDYLKLHKKLKKQNGYFEEEVLELAKEGLGLLRQIGAENSSYSGGGDWPSFISKLTDKNYDAINFEGRLAKSIAKDTWCSAKASYQDKQAIEARSEDIKNLYLKIESFFDTHYKTYVLANLILKNLIPLSVLSELNICLDSYKADNNIRLNSEFNTIIRKHIKDEPVPFIYEKIGEKFNYFFIDEMQDTSVFQWENLVPLIANSIHQPNSSLFLVGDAKQAIYRWRGGKAQQFMCLASKKDDTRCTTTSNNPFFIQKKIETLNTNFRSYSEVIGFNNSFFKNTAKFLSNPTHKAIYLNENSQKTTDKLGGYIQLNFLEKGLKGDDKSKAYSNKIIYILKNLDDKYALNEVCILVRSKKDGIKIAENLIAEGFDIVTSESLLLCNDSKVIFIVNFLKYLVFDSDKKALAEALIFLHGHLNIKIPIHNFISGLIKFSKNELFKSLKAYGISFTGSAFNEMSLYQSVTYLVRSFKLINSSDVFIQYFLEEVLKFEQKQKSDLSCFLDYFESNKSDLSIVSPKNSNAIQILTIHKAKGLEFPVVIFPNNVNIYKEIKPLEWYNPQNRKDFNGFETLLIDGGSKLEKTDTTGQSIYALKKEALELDNINLLYVGLTRAIEQLYIITERGSKSITYGSIFEDFLKTASFWQADKNTYTFGHIKRCEQKPSDKKEKDIAVALKHISTDWKSHNIHIVPNASKYWNTSQQEAAVYGTLLHDILAQIKTEDDISIAISQYQRTGKITEKEALNFKKILLQLVNHPELSQYYSVNSNVYNECEILTRSKEVLRLDRLVLSDNKAVIIDYKTGKPQAAHHHQLNDYAKAINAMNLNVIKKILVYLEDPVKVVFVD